MQLSQSVKLKQKQSLVMTPQLQQAIKLLQLSNLELGQHLQEQVDENPFLEIDIEDSGVESAEPNSEKDAVIEPAISADHNNNLSELNESAALAEDPTENGDFENRFDQSIVDAPHTSSPSTPFDGDFDTISNVSSSEGFYPSLFRQLNLVIEDPKKRLIAGHFVNALETSGWIGMSVEEVADASGSSVEEADAVLTTLQTFEPTGLFARNLADCLRLQLIEMGAMTEAFSILLENLELLEARSRAPVQQGLEKIWSAQLRDELSVENCNLKPRNSAFTCGSSKSRSSCRTSTSWQLGAAAARRNHTRGHDMDLPYHKR